MYKRNMPQMAAEGPKNVEGVRFLQNLGLGVLMAALAILLVGGVLGFFFASMNTLPRLDQVGLGQLSEQAALAELSEEASRQ